MVKLAVAIPDSSLSDEQTLRDKTVKVGQFARAFSIFRVQEVIIYHDKSSRPRVDDEVVLTTLLEFLDTPQYLRRILYPLSPVLQYSGILHPVKTPHHKPPQDPGKIRRGEKRVGVLGKIEGKLHVDAGIGVQIPFNGAGAVGEKVIVEFTSTFPRLVASRSVPDDSEYWGYKVSKTKSPSQLLSDKKWALRIVTSRSGSAFQDVSAMLAQRISQADALLVIFGSPRQGVGEILHAEGASLKTTEIIVNTFPRQATETVRLEEAILGTLAILNASFRL